MKTNGGRTSNAMHNAGFGMVTMIMKYVFAFVSRTLFIKFLGEVFLGVDELLTNILYILSIAELGLSTAIGFSLYAPIANGDTAKISGIMSFLKKAYRLIGLLVAIFGIVLYFSIPVLVRDESIAQNVTNVYFLYLFSTVITYFVSYKDILITADQKFYKVAKINVVFLLISFVAEIFAIAVLKNYVSYVLVKLVVLLIQRVVINSYISKQYPEVDFCSKRVLDKVTKKEIKKNVRGLVIHKIGDYAVNGTDNIIISYFLDIVVVGFYSNYMLLARVMQNVLAAIYDGLMPSFGSLITENNTKKVLRIFKNVDFMGFFMYGLLGVVFACSVSDFVKLWIGEEYTLSQVTVALISISFFLTGMRMSTYAVKSAAGIFKEDSWSPFVQAVVNLVFSIALCQFMGLDGVVLGTVVSAFVPTVARVYYLFKLIFKEQPYKYLTKYYLPYVLHFIVILIATLYACSFINTSVALVDLLIKGLFACAVFLITFVIMFSKREEFAFLREMFIKVIRRIVRKWKR